MRPCAGGLIHSFFIEADMKRLPLALTSLVLLTSLAGCDTNPGGPSAPAKIQEGVTAAKTEAGVLAPPPGKGKSKPPTSKGLTPLSPD